MKRQVQESSAEFNNLAVGTVIAVWVSTAKQPVLEETLKSSSCCGVVSAPALHRNPAITVFFCGIKLSDPLLARHCAENAYCWHQKRYIQKNLFWGINLCNVIDYTYIMKSSRELIYVM